MTNGPRGMALINFTCTGCPALKTEDWEFEEENDGRDSGVDAKCSVVDKHIDSYWRDGKAPPAWCPHHDTPTIKWTKA